MPGSYKKLSAYKMNATADLRSDYATLKNRAALDNLEEEKIWGKISDGSLKPFSNYRQLLQMLVHRINRTWVLRGALEPHGLHVQDLSFHTHGEMEDFTGLTSISLDTIRKAKTKKLSHKNTSFAGEDFDNSILEDSKNDYCVVSLILFYMKNHVEIDYKGKFFLHSFGPKQIEERAKKGIFMLGNTERPFGLNFFNQLEN